MGLQDKALSSCESVSGSVTAIPIPDPFTSIDEARICLDYIWYQFTAVAFDEQDRVDFARVISHWSTSLGNFLSACRNPDEQTLKGAWSLEMNRVLLEIMLNHRSHRELSPKQFDGFLPYYQEMIALAKKIQHSVRSEYLQIRHANHLY